MVWLHKWVFRAATNSSAEMANVKFDCLCLCHLRDRVVAILILLITTAAFDCSFVNRLLAGCYTVVQATWRTFWSQIVFHINWHVVSRMHFCRCAVRYYCRLITVLSGRIVCAAYQCPGKTIGSTASYVACNYDLCVAQRLTRIHVSERSSFVVRHLKKSSLFAQTQASGGSSGLWLLDSGGSKSIWNVHRLQRPLVYVCIYLSISSSCKRPCYMLNGNDKRTQMLSSFSFYILSVRQPLFVWY